MRTGGRFRVVLNTEGHRFRIGKSLGSPVVEVFVGRLAMPGDGSGNDDKTVILRCNLNLSRLFLPHRLVDAVMAEFQFFRFPSGGLSEDLMTQADAEDRNLSQDIGCRRHQIGEGCRISRAIGKENPIGLPGKDILPRCRCRQDDDLAAPSFQVTEDVVFNAAVDDDDPERFCPGSRRQGGRK